MGCGPLPSWLKDKRYIYAIDKFDDDLCVWQCPAIYMRKNIQWGTEFVTRTTLQLAHETMVIKIWKKKDTKPTKLANFEGIAKHHNINIMLYEPRKDKGKDAGYIWRQLVYSKIQHKNDLPTRNMRLLGRLCFCIKRMDVLCNRWEGKGCRQIFTRNEDLTRHLKEKRCTGRKTRINCSGGKSKHILNSSEKLFYGGDTKFSYAACQWFAIQAIETCKHIHHKMCGHGGERMVNV